MNAKFFDLKKDKQDRMINAALKVFALNGYKHASTDDIVKEAGISKGLLFHYFGSKVGVYEFVYEYSVRYMILELGTKISRGESDMFEITKQIELARMDAMKGYPYMQQFLNMCDVEDVSEALLAIEGKKNLLEAEYERIYSQISFRGLPTGVDGRKLLKMMDLTIKGLLQEKFREGTFQPEMLYGEIAEYIDMMKKMCRK
jgi:AcrR family transcriptional regulator